MDTRITGTRGRQVAVAAAALTIAATGYGVAVTGPSAAADPPPIAVEVLAGHSDFPDRVGVTHTRQFEGGLREVIRRRDAGHVVVARITVQPGAAFPWHTHPGAAVVSVTSGALVYQQASDCVEREYGAAESFLDPGNRVHTAWNPGGEPTVLVATFHGVPDGGAVTVPTADQSDRCA